MALLAKWPASAKKLRDTQNIPVWLVWTLATNKNVILRAITFTEERANMYKEAVKNDGKVLRCYVEKTLANHLYAGVFDVYSAKSSAEFDIQKRKGMML